MNKEIKNKTLSVRITEQQLINLTNALHLEKIKQSQFLRECIEVYGRSCRIENELNENDELIKNRDFNTKNEIL